VSTLDDRTEHTRDVARDLFVAAARETAPVAVAALVAALKMTAREVGLTDADLVEFILEHTVKRPRRTGLAS